jgi:hypothetical protein
VDITDERNGAEFPDQDRYVFREIPLSDTARVPLQAKLDVDRGWVFFGPLTYYAHTRHAVVVRLYRPGYHTIEVARSEDARYARWVEAKGDREREKAVDDLLSTWKTDTSGQVEHYCKCKPGEGTPRPPEDAALFRCVAPGSVGDAHRRVLLFAADEYERLATGDGPGSVTPADVQRLRAKLEWLCKRAQGR